MLLNEMVISSSKYEVVNAVISSFESRMALTVRRLTAADVGGYRCVAKNSLGEVDSIIRLYEIPGPTIKNTSPANKREEYKYSTPIEGPDNQFGSADRSDDEDERETATDTTDRQSNAYKHENVTRNKTIHYSSTPEQKLSNKVRKIINKFEIQEFGDNRCSSIHSVMIMNFVSLLIAMLDHT